MNASEDCSMPLWNCLRERFREVWSETSSDVGALIGCSGGADSVALTRLIVERYRTRHAEADRGAPPLCIAHFNHRLRGKQSVADEAFVRALATRLGVTLYVGQAGSDGSCDAEAGLRQDRLDFFARTAAETGCRYVVLAHTCDDQAETVLHHLLRGTGAAGLRGIQPARPLGSDFVIRRPLLTFRREELRAGLQEIGQTWREDASNQDTRYTRNWIRHEALPTLRLRFPHAVDAISRAAENQWQTDDLIGRMARQWIDAFVAADSEVDRRGQNSDSVELIQFARPSLMSWSTTKTLLERWPHSDSMAREIPIVVAACQKVFAERDWPRRDMSREHWMRLADAIVSTDIAVGASEQDGQTPRADIAAGPIDRREVSLGHWPGHIEGIRTTQFVTLRWTRKRDDNT